jgi:hypothetical protein
MVTTRNVGRYSSPRRCAWKPSCGAATLAAALLAAGCPPARDATGCDEHTCDADCRDGGYASGFCNDGLCSCVGGDDAGWDGDDVGWDGDDAGAEADATPDGHAPDAADDGGEAGCAERDLGSAVGRDLVTATSTTADHVASCGSRPDMPVAWTAPHAGVFRFLISCRLDEDVSLAFLDGVACDGPLLACETYSCCCIPPVGSSGGRYEDCCFVSGLGLERTHPLTLAAGQRLLVVLDETCTLSIEDGSLDEDGGACFNGADDDDDGYTDCRDFDCDDDCTETAAECHDDVDDDHDGLTDCADGDCREACVEICPNAVDDDEDGFTDCDDPDCTAQPEPFHPGSCLDGLDNDCDGETDCRDTDCDFFNPECPEDCVNHVDDDGDGRIDCTDGFCLDDLACL